MHYFEAILRVAPFIIIFFCCRGYTLLFIVVIETAFR